MAKGRQEQERLIEAWWEHRNAVLAFTDLAEIVPDAARVADSAWASMHETFFRVLEAGASGIPVKTRWGDGLVTRITTDDKVEVYFSEDLRVTVHLAAINPR